MVQDWLTSPMPRVFLNYDCLPTAQLPHPEPSMMAQGIKYPVLFGQFGSACLAVSPPGVL